MIGKAIEFSENHSNVANHSHKLPDELVQGVKLVWHIFDGIISIFGQVNVSLDQQLKNLSMLAHILLNLYRRNGTSFMPGQLYYDLQRMIQGCYYASTSLQVRGGGSMYLYQLGTDQLERLFSSVRTVTHAKNP